MVEIMKNYLIKLYIFMFLFFKKTHYSNSLNDEELKDCYWQTNITFSTIILMPLLGVTFTFLNFDDLNGYFQLSGPIKRFILLPFVLIYLFILFYLLNKINKIVSFEDKYLSDFTIREKISKYSQVVLIFISFVGIPMFLKLFKYIFGNI